MKVYIYKQFCDGNAYGEEIIDVYANKDDAMKALKEDVESNYDAKWEDIPEKVELGEDDTFEKDYVSISNGDNTSFWFIEEKEII
ncbi:hypothetical protein [Butyrivibrio hungatei]|uniref:Uncharacterized protein n=1 Tax=Butyrivibrio hungatei TaxID=185008 RepID=A0A1D9P5P0_9FIRM|nr:hypothetical protein [Butyrivibrio hungatei]AOZ97898.1 hypothetical protein bhn_II099 [Butyrivibrio hungatei]